MSKAKKASFPSLVLALFARTFPGESWAAWRVLLKAVLGRPLTRDEQETFTACTGRTSTPSTQAEELWCIVGRRSGKSRVSAFLAVCLAVLKPYRLAPGERPLVAVVAPTRDQTDIIMDYARAMVPLVPGVTIVRDTDDGIDLSTGVRIGPRVASYRTVRGWTVVGAVLDESAFFRADDSSNPDKEILRALRPSLLTTPDALLISISSPYAAKGELYRTFEKHFTRDSSTLVWKADSRTMNPTIDAAKIARAYEDDPDAASAEFGANFRSDLEDLFRRSALAAVVVPGRGELQPVPGVSYIGFVDPSGGSRDSMTLAIAHKDLDGRAVLDLTREVRPPFKPEDVCRDFAKEIQKYRCVQVFADSYGGIWPAAEFLKASVTLESSPLTRSEIYLELLPLVHSGNCDLIDDQRLIAQLANLERRTGRTGKDAVDHPRGGFDDLANAAAGALVMVTQAEGLQASYPPTFTQCNNEAASTRCALLRTSAWLPHDAWCHRECAGHKAAAAAWQRYQQRVLAGQEPNKVTCVVFLKRTFTTPAFVSRRLHDAIEASGFYA